MADDEVVILKSNDDQAEQSEDILSLDALEQQNADSVKEETEPQQEPKNNKKIFIIIAIVAIVIVVILAIVLFFVFKKDSNTNFNVSQIAQDVQKNYKTYDFTAPKIDEMIQKANKLYEKGNKFEALKIYENIATYNKSLSNYNLGVSQMKQDNCNEAIESFKKAISDKENIVPSAINSAVCSLILNNIDGFKYYIELANSFLQEEARSPLYTYYYALINYYKGNYFEALATLNHKSSKYYKDKYDYLSAKILALLNENDSAIEMLKDQKEFNADLTIAQLYAKMADYDRARIYLERALKKGIDVDKIKMTMALIDLKTNYYDDAAIRIKEIYSKDKLAPSKIYRIKAILNPELFNINVAQNHFNNDIFFDKTRRFETIFYFAPYKVFDAKQTMRYITKGGVSVFLDDTSAANDFLSKGVTISKVNAKLSSAISKALSYKLKEANKEFLKLTKLYPEHSILQYNLALSYAQLGNFSQAAKHFSMSYHMDRKNYLAGVFSAISADITQSLNQKFITELTDNIHDDRSLKGANLYTALLSLIDGNQSALLRWLEESKDETTLNVAFDAIIAKLTSQDELMREKTAKLIKILPNDIVAHILNFISNYQNENIKEYAKRIQIYFNNKELNQEAFYHGASIIRKQYVKLLQVSGLLYRQRDELEEKLKLAPRNTNLLQTLAYIDIFTNDFERSYELYNKIIDEYKIDDAGTLFLASVAATGANKVQNAIALLELSKLTDPNAIENRVALGFLYQQIDNIEAALIQYSKIGNVVNNNEFYDFAIVNE